jgi:hypothetical protein
MATRDIVSGEQDLPHFPLSSSMASSRPAKLPAPVSSRTQSPSSPTPRNLFGPLDTLRTLKSFPSPDAVNTTTGPQLPKYVPAAFGSLDLPWKPGHLRLALRPIYRHMFKPLKQIDDIFLAQILGHKRDRTRPFP